MCNEHANNYLQRYLSFRFMIITKSTASAATVKNSKTKMPFDNNNNQIYHFIFFQN